MDFSTGLIETIVTQIGRPSGPERWGCETGWDLGDYRHLLEDVGKPDIRIFLTSVFVKKSKRNFDKVNAPTLFY